MESNIPCTNEINSFVHCKRCRQEQLPQYIEAGFTPIGFQVWCKWHDINIMHMDLDGEEPPYNGNTVDPVYPPENVN